LVRWFQLGCPSRAGEKLAVSLLSPHITTRFDVTSRVKASARPGMAAAAPITEQSVGSAAEGSPSGEMHPTIFQ